MPARRTVLTRHRGRHGRPACQARPFAGRNAVGSIARAVTGRAATLGTWPNAIPMTSSASSAAPAPRDQGRLAAARPAAPSRPDRRRSGGLAGRDAPDGRDQRRLCGADAGRRRNGTSQAGQGDADVEFDGARTASRRPAASEADAPGDRPGRHEPDVPAAQPRPTHERAARPGRPAAADGAIGRAASRRAPRHPTGPLERDRIRDFRPPPRPTLEDARAIVVRLRQVPRPHARPDRGVRAVVHRLAGRAPSQRDPDLRLAARVIQDDLDQRGIVRRTHPDAASDRRRTGRRRYDA